MRIPAPLLLEPLLPAHARELFPGLSDPAGYRFLPDAPPASVRALEDRYARQARGRSPDGAEIWLNWIVRQRPGGAALGYTQATIRDGTALIGYHMVPACWGRGIGTLAVRLTLEILFARADVRDVRALVDTRNRASIALLRRLGVTLERTVVAADHFGGQDSDEHEFVLSVAAWQSHHSSASGRRRQPPSPPP